MTRVGGKLFSVLLVLAIATSYVPDLQAQTQNTGAIQGRVFEAGSIAPLPGAVVTVTHEDIGLERSTVTDNQGYYYVGILPAGTYRIAASLQGYENDPDPKNSIITGFLIHITNTEKADQPPPIILRKAGAATTQPPPARPTTPPPAPTAPPRRQAQAAAESDVSSMVNTSNATRGANFGEIFLLALPLPGVRTFDDLAFLAPGVAPPPLAIGVSLGPGLGPGVGSSGQFSVNGLRSRANNFTIDGSDNNDEEVGVRRQGFTSLVPQSIESVQEFQISTLLAEPQFGRNMAAQVNVVSRSGGSGFHGTIYGFITDKRLKARDPFDFTGGPASFTLRSGGRDVLLNGGAPITIQNPVGGENPYTRAQYGFVLGGPIVKNKTHFFVSFEHQDVNAARESHFAVPTVAERGLFGKGDRGLVINETRTFPTSVVGNAFTSLYPFANNPDGPYGANTFTEILPANAHGSIMSGKLDQNMKAFGIDHTLTGRYNFTDDNTILPFTGEALFSSLRALVRTQDFALSLNSSLTNRTVNQFRFSWGRTTLNFKEVRDPFLVPSTLAPNTPFLLNAPLLFNITVPGGPPNFLSFPGLNLDTERGVDPIGGATGLATTGTGAIGQVFVSGFSPIGVDVFNFPQGRTNDTFQYADTIIFSRGRHRLVGGFDIRQTHLNSFLDRNFRSQAVFNGLLDASPSQVAKEGGVCVSDGCLFLGRDYLAAGAATGFYQAIANGNVDSRIRMRYWQNDFFFSDQIRIGSRFTLTAGLRYEFNTVPTEQDRLIESTFTSPEVTQFEDLEKAAVGVSGLEHFLADRSEIFNQDNNNFAPHLALAWDPMGNGKMAIRAGYGIYYDQILGAVVSQSRNVFPRFLTFNLGGFNEFANVNDPQTLFAEHRFLAGNPANIFAIPGTLNTYDLKRRGDPVLALFADAFLTNLASGPGFVLPNADLETPYAQHWGLTIERQFGKDFLASAAYVGTRGVHLLRFATPNLGPNALPFVTDLRFEAPLGSDNLRFPQLFGISIAPTESLARAGLRPFPFLGSITTIESDANSTYHSLQLQLNKRFSRGFQFTTAYTWSHALDEVSDLFDMAGAPALPQNSSSERAERGDANFDVRHRFVYSFVWDLPFGDNWLIGGWQAASIGTFQTGQPYSVLVGIDANADGNPTDRIDKGFDQNGEPLNAGAGSRNTFRAPGIATVNLSLNKRFLFGERHKIEFRSEFYNLFNRVNFGIPVHELFFAGFGLTPASQQHFINTQVPMRTIQFALKYSF